MELHQLGWQVHRAYIDEGIDFTITKYYCHVCKKYSNQYIRYTKRNGKNVKCFTNLCEHCKETELPIRNDGVVLKKSTQNTGYDYSIFNTRFYNDFNALEIELKEK